MTAVVDEREALMNLFASLKGEDWHNNRGWGTKKELKEWFGLKINDEGKVVSIQLDQNNLRGNFRFRLCCSLYLIVCYCRFSVKLSCCPERVESIIYA